MQQAHAAIASADAAFGTLPLELLRKAERLRWLQAPHAAPPAGYYYPELIAHPLAVTNFREIYNDHIGAHIMAYVLAFARGRTIVTWNQQGHTCVIAAPATVPSSRLVDLAASRNV